MTNVFDLDNRMGIPQFDKTLRRISDMLSDKINVLKHPLIMISAGTSNSPILQFRGPYFQGKPVNFTASYDKDTKFIFYILANNFKETFSSHALVGYWNGSKIIIFDPNGDITSSNYESVYQGYGFKVANSVRNLQNPLYKTLLKYFKRKALRVDFYTGEPIPCPVNVQKSCAYRCLLYIIARAKYRDNDTEVYKYTKELVPKLQNIENIANLIELA